MRGILNACHQLICVAGMRREQCCDDAQGTYLAGEHSDASVLVGRLQDGGFFVDGGTVQIALVYIAVLLDGVLAHSVGKGMGRKVGKADA